MYCRDEIELKWEVVDAILNLMPRMEVLQVDRHLVGVEEHMNMCIQKLEMMSISDICLLGLVGMGGVGKTSLAKQIYNYFIDHKRFEATSFLKIDRHSPSSIEVGWCLMSRLQEQLLWDLLRVSENNERRYNYWFHRLSRKGPMLVVLDDVHEKNQFDEVILDSRLLAPRSCIIVTSQDQHLLKVIAQELEFYLYEVRPLGNDDSQRFFNLHVFGNEEASEKFKALVNDVSKGCGGLPLALKVVGSSLVGKRSNEDLESIWPEAIDALKEDYGFISALQWSYDCLSEQEKMMFVDIACVFHGRDKREVLEIWKSCKECSSCCDFGAPHTSLRRLIDKSLVVLEDDNILFMHGLLRGLGKRIGIQHGSHLWKGNVGKATEGKSQGPNKVRALNLSGNGNDRFEVENFAKMTNLHFLTLDGCNIDGDFGSTFKELRSLQWRYMRLSYVPLLHNFSNLISLDFLENTNLTNLLEKPIYSASKGFANLFKLNLSGYKSVTLLPDFIHSLSQLPVLDLDFCMDLRKLPNSVGQLTGLQELRLSQCRSLEAISDSITSMSGLQSIFKPLRSSISELPTSFGLMSGMGGVSMDLATKRQAVAVGQLNAVQYLTLSVCTDEAITALDGLGALKNLHQLSYFTFIFFPYMTKLPVTIGLWTILDYLELYNCQKLQKLPNSIGQLKCLRKLYIKECFSLEALPDSLDALTCLQKLRILKCISLKNLPTSIGQLSRLQELRIEGCYTLESLPKDFKPLEALRMFSILHCGSLEVLRVASALQGLRIWGSCTSITFELPGSCLMVVDSNFFNPHWYKHFKHDGFIYRNLREVQVAEADACGYLRLVIEPESGGLMWQRVYTTMQS